MCVREIGFGSVSQQAHDVANKDEKKEKEESSLHMFLGTAAEAGTT